MASVTKTVACKAACIPAFPQLRVKATSQALRRRAWDMEGERAEEGYSAVAQSERDAMAGAPAANVWTKAAGLSGMAAVALGAYGAHMFKPENPAYKDVFKTGNLYHLVHSAALLACPLMKRPNLFGGLMSFGIVAFSGSCYLSAVYEDRKLGAGAPFGGFSLIAAWASALL